MTPIIHPHERAEECYNAAQTSTRSVIERGFGVLKHRFRCLHKSGGALTYTPAKLCQIILACSILHNICINGNVPFEEDDDNSDDESGNEDDDYNEDRGDNNGGNEGGNVGGNNNRHNDGWLARMNLIQHRFN